MSQLRFHVSSLLLAVSAATVAVGLAVNDGFVSPVRAIVGFLLTVGGLAGVASVAGGRSLSALRSAVRRWWLLAAASFVPYAGATAPATGAAAAIGGAFSGPIAVVAVEALAGAAALCAVTVTVVYWFAANGLHPGRPSPEERVLGERDA